MNKQRNTDKNLHQYIPITRETFIRFTVLGMLLSGAGILWGMGLLPWETKAHAMIQKQKVAKGFNILIIKLAKIETKLDAIDKNVDRLLRHTQH